MSLNLIVDGSTASPAAHTDDENTMYLKSREPSLSGGSRRTDEVWNGATVAARAMFEEYRTKPLIKDMRLSQSGEKSELLVSWGVDFAEGETPDRPEEESSEWSWSPIEIPTPLAAHPYFQVAYADGSGEFIENEIARCEAAIKRGRQYTASGDYSEWMKRYYGLRMAGVEEWHQFGIELVRTRTVDEVGVVKDAHATAGKAYSINDIDPPADVKAAIQGLEKIESYDGSDPGEPNFDAARFQFVKRPPQCKYSIVDGDGRFDITETWLGLAVWSAVLYPNGSWDPMGDVEE